MGLKFLSFEERRRNGVTGLLVLQSENDCSLGFKKRKIAIELLDLEEDVYK